MNIYEKVHRVIHEYHLIEPGELILVAVSGGPDSLALLHILHSLQKECKYRLHVVHLNHQLREEAAAEAEFVRNFAESRDISVTILKYDIPVLLKEEGGSVQNQAREIRYRLFNQVADQIGATKIALGHHADDLAETVLMRFLRGSGLEGLVGFTALSRELLIRPLIGVTREEIENYCIEVGLSPRYDPSNQKTVYLRNQIRLELLPLLEKGYNPKLRQQLVQMSHIFDEENQVIEELARNGYRSTLLHAESNVLTFHFLLLSKKNPAILRRILRLGMETLKGDKKDLYYQHYLQMQELIYRGSPGKMLNLPNDLLLYRGYKKILLGDKKSILGQRLSTYDMLIPGEVELQEIDLTVQAEVVEGQVIIAENQVGVDADLVGNQLRVRSRQGGDRFCPLGLKGSKKVKDFFIDEKVDRLQRDRVPILTTTDNQIVWIVGYRLDDRFKVTQKTKRTCVLTILKEGIE